MKRKMKERTLSKPKLARPTTLLVSLMVVATLLVSSAAAVGPASQPTQQITFLSSAKPFSNFNAQQSVPPTDDPLLQWVHYDSGVNDDAIGLTSGGTFEVAARYTATELGIYTGGNITTVKFFYGYTGGAPPGNNGVLKIYGAGTSSAPGALITSQAFTAPPASSGYWYQVNLTTPVAVAGTTDIWVGVEWTGTLAGQYPAGCDAGPYVPGKSDWIYLGSWTEISVYGFNINWMIWTGIEGGSGLPDNEVGINDITAPASGIATGPITPTVKVENFGDVDQEDVPVSVNIVRYGTPTTMYTDGFESYVPGYYALPPGWTTQTTNPTGTWFMYTSSTTYSASTYPRVQESGSDGFAQDESLISPTIDCSALTSVQVAFTKSFYAYSPDYATFTLYGSIDNGATWPYTLCTYSSTSTAAENINFPAAVGMSQVKFKFRFESPADATLSSYLYFDNFWVGTYLPFGPQGNVPPVGWTISNAPADPTTWTNNFWHRYAYTSYDSILNAARVYYTSPYEDVDCSLITPSFNCSAMSTVKLFLNGYFYYYSTNPGYGFIEVSTDGGVNWTDTGVITTASKYFYEYPGYNDIDISAWAAGESNVKVRFRYQHTAAQAGRYWYISNVRVGSGYDNNIILRDSFNGPQAYSTNFKYWMPDSWGIWNKQHISGTSTYNWNNVISGSSPTCTPHSGARMAQYQSYNIPVGGVDRLYTTPFNVAAANTLKVRFWMYHDTGYPGDQDSIQPQACVDGVTWVNVGAPITRPGTVNGWSEHIIDYTAYADATALQIGFLATSAYGNNMYIDDMEIFDPGLIGEYTQSTTVDVPAGDVVTVTFPAWTPAAWHTVENANVQYDVKAQTTLTNDSNPANDVRVETFTLNYPFFHDIKVDSLVSPITDGDATTFPVSLIIKNVGQYAERQFFVDAMIGEKVYNITGFFTNLEANDGGFTEGLGTQWAWGTPSGAGPGAAYSGTKLWATVLGGNYAAGHDALDSPIITVPTGADLTFWHWYDFEASYDGYNVKISTAPYTTWTLLTPVGGYTGTANSANPLYPQPCWTGHVQKFWEQETFDLAAYEGLPVKIRFDFGADSSVFYPGAYIDDILVGQVTVSLIPEYDELAAVASWLNPGQTMTLTFPDWTPDGIAAGISGDIEYGYIGETLLGTDTNAANNEMLAEFVLHYRHDVQVKSINDPSFFEPTWVGYDNGVNVDAIGLTSGGTFETAIRLTSTELGAYAGYDLTQLKVFVGYTGSTPPSFTGVAKIYGPGTSTAPGALLSSKNFVTPGGTADWFTVVLDTPVAITGTEDLWVATQWVSTAAGTYPAGCDGGPHVPTKSDWVYLSSWVQISTYGFDLNWMLRAGVEAGGGGPGNIDIWFQPGTQPIGATVKNTGTFTESGLSCLATIFDYTSDPNGTLVYNDTIAGIVLDALGEEEVLNFDSYNFATDGHYTLTVTLPLATDDAPSNNEKTLDIGIDSTAPSSTYAINPATPGGQNGWYVSPVTITLTATDAGCGVDAIKYTIDGGSTQTYSGPFTVSADGEHTVKYWAVDKVGNTETQNTAPAFKIDQGAPIIDLTKEKLIGKLRYTAACTDDTSGIAYVEFYMLDQLQFTDTEAPYQWILQPVPNVQNLSVKAIAYDFAGNFAFDIEYGAASSQSTQTQTATTIPRV